MAALALCLALALSIVRAKDVAILLRERHALPPLLLEAPVRVARLAITRGV